MLETEQNAAPDPTPSTDGFADLMAEAETLTVEPDAPSDDEATPADEATGTAPATDSAPAADASADPAATAEPEGDTPPADAPQADQATSQDSPNKDAPPFVFKVDGREVTLAGAREEGENIVIPKQVWHTEVKNFLADRQQFARRESQYQQALKQAQAASSQNEKVAGEMLGELDRIMGLPEAESFDEWEKMRSGYGERKAKAEADYYKQQATRGQEAEQSEADQQQMAQYTERLTAKLGDFADQAMEAVKEQLKGLDPEDAKELRGRLVELLTEDAQAGRIYQTTGEFIEGTRLPKLTVDFQRVAAVVDREVRVVRKSLERMAAMKKQAAEIEAAARKNAAEEAKRRTPTPPAVTPKSDSAAAGGKAKEPESWDDLMAEAEKL